MFGSFRNKSNDDEKVYDDQDVAIHLDKNDNPDSSNVAIPTVFTSDFLTGNPFVFLPKENNTFSNKE